MITVDWKNGANDLYYPESAANTRVVAAIVGKLVALLRDEFLVDLKNVHLIGHSLGAHICGYIGTRVPGIGRITGTSMPSQFFACVRACVRAYMCVYSLRVCVSIMGAKSVQGHNGGRKEMFYLTMPSIHFIYGYIASDTYIKEPFR